MPTVDEFSLIKPQWKHYRMVHSRYPVKNLFDDDNQENEKLHILANETSDRLHYASEFVDELDVLHGEGYGAVMTSFCYPRVGRFSSDKNGAYYCANNPDAALTEWAHHTARFWRACGYSDEFSAVVRSYIGKFTEPLLDVREVPRFHQKEDLQYKTTRAFAAEARAAGAWGVLYNSVRHAGSLCAALLRPPATSPVTQASHYVLVFDGGHFVEYAELGKRKTLPWQ